MPGERQAEIALHRHTDKPIIMYDNDTLKVEGDVGNVH